MFQLLTKQLKEFGLNPSDWIIFKEPRQLSGVLIQHREDPSVNLLGNLCQTSGGLKWKSIDIM